MLLWKVLALQMVNLPAVHTDALGQHDCVVSSAFMPLSPAGLRRERLPLSVNQLALTERACALTSSKHENTSPVQSVLWGLVPLTAD